MKTKAICYLSIALIAGGAWCGHLWAQSAAARATPGEVASTRAFMREKLVYSQGVLEGITLEQYGLVRTNAQKLSNMTQSNLFFRVKNEEYLSQAAKFTRNLEKLVAAAEKERLQDATASFKRVTQSCVDCHRWFRSEQRPRRGEVVPETELSVGGTYPVP